MSRKNLLTDFLPSVIAFDTNFVSYALNKTDKDRLVNSACYYFLNRLLASSTKVYLSAIIFPEFWRASLTIAVGKKYNLQDELHIKRKIAKERKTISKDCLAEVIQQARNLDRLLEIFRAQDRLLVVETSTELMSQAEAHMVKYNLEAMDALHLAAMTTRVLDSHGTPKPYVRDLVTFDRGIIDDCANDFNVWHKGRYENELVEYEKTLPPRELDPHGPLNRRRPSNRGPTPTS